MRHKKLKMEHAAQNGQPAATRFKKLQYFSLK
jgi:hypothetical protein